MSPRHNDLPGSRRPNFGLGTVTAKPSVAESPSGSRAVAVTRVSPEATPATVRMLPVAVAAAVSEAPETAVYVSGSPSGSAKYSARSSAALRPTSTTWPGIFPATCGLRFGGPAIQSQAGIPATSARIRRRGTARSTGLADAAPRLRRDEPDREQRRHHDHRRVQLAVASAQGLDHRVGDEAEPDSGRDRVGEGHGQGRHRGGHALG